MSRALGRGAVADLRDLYGDASQAQMAAKRDQAMALLFARSNWTQEELAAKEGKSPQWVAQRLRFGQLLTSFSQVLREGRPLRRQRAPARFSAPWNRFGPRLSLGDSGPCKTLQ